MTDEATLSGGFHGDPRQRVVEQVVEEAILLQIQGREFDPEEILSRIEDDALRDVARQRLSTFIEMRGKLERIAEPDGARVIGDFRIIRELGRGGMGVVYLARQVSLDREVALKVLPGLSALSPDRVERFLREASTLAALRHPAIVPVLTAGEDDGVLHFAMEYVPGPSLEQVLLLLDTIPPARRSTADLLATLPDDSSTTSLTDSYVEFICGVFIQTGEALVHAHGCGVLHRDLKPSNILLTASGQARLVDFGLAQAASAETLTRSADVLGTPHYLPPEIVRDGSTVSTVRSDIYSLGVSLYRCLAGSVPFAGESITTLLRAIETGDARPLRSANPEVPRDLETICGKAMERDPERRYPTADALVDDLRAFLEYRPILARPPSLARRAALFSRRNRPLVFVAGLALLVVIAVVGFVLIDAWINEAEADDLARSAWLALEQGDAERVRGDWERLVAVSRQHPQREPLKNALSLLECEDLLAEARAIRQQRDEAREHREEMLPKLSKIMESATSNYLPPAERRRGLEMVAEYETLYRSNHELFDRLLRTLGDARARAARAGVDDHPPVLRAFADAYMMRWREDLADGHRHGAQTFEKLVREYDVERRYADELDGLGKLEISGCEGATAYLFHYRPFPDVHPDGWQDRLVPTPLRWPSDVIGQNIHPGDTCLLVTDAASTGLLRADDLVFAIEGRPVDGSIFVIETRPGSPAAALGIQSCDRVVRVNERPIVDIFDVELQWRAGPGPWTVELERPGWSGTIEIPAGSAPAGDTGMLLGDSRLLLQRGATARDIAFSVFRDGKLSTITAETGQVFDVDARFTAYPLLLCNKSRLGRLPLAEPLTLAPGSYMLLLRAPGHADLRYPISIPRGEAVQVEPVMLGSDLSPPDDSVWIAGGLVELGIDPLALHRTGQQQVEVEGFWMQRAEVTAEDWARFLADPETVTLLEEQESQDRLTLVPRSFRYGEPRWTRTAPGCYEPPAHWRDLPIHCVSYEDVAAYVHWLDRKMLAEGSPWQPVIPSQAEFARAARGADRRCFPWGDGYDTGLCKSALSHPDPEIILMEPGLRFLGDESPFGVRDLAGNVSEWTRDRDPRNPAPIFRGGACVSLGEDDFRIDTRGNAHPEDPQDSCGLRLIFRERQ